MMSRDEMILSQQRSVQIIAKQVYKHIRCRIPLDDLIQSGYVGLIRAVDRYDGRCALESYTAHRIRGAILDSIREEDFLPKTARKKLRGQPDEPHMVNLAACAEVPDPARNQEDIMVRSSVRRACGTLSPRLRLVVAEYYEDGYSHSEIAEHMGLGESRVSQLHKDARARLKMILVA